MRASLTDKTFLANYKDTGEVITKFSEHRWITNFNVTRDNLHEVANLGARKRWGIEDSNNTEKNRGYKSVVG